MTDPASKAIQNKKREIVEWLRSLVAVNSERHDFRVVELKNLFRVTFVTSNGGKVEIVTKGKALHHLEDLKRHVIEMFVERGFVERVPF